MDASRLIEIIEAAGLSYESYRGRGMVHECIAVHVRPGEETKTLAKLIRASGAIGEAADLMARTEIDSPMLYWPHANYIEP